MIRPVLAIAFKDVKLAYNDARDILLHLLVPICVASLLGLAMSGLAGRDAPTAKLTVVDEADTETSRVFVEKLRRNPNLQFEGWPLEEALSRLRAGRLSGVLVIQKGFEFERLYRGQAEALKLHVDPSRLMLKSMIEGLVQRAGFETLAELMFRPERAGDTIRRAEADIDRAPLDPQLKAALKKMLRHNEDFLSELRRLQQEGRANAADFPFLSGGIRVQTEAVGGEGRNYFAIVFPGVAVMFMLFSSMGGALGLLKEKWHGVLRRILASPVTPLQIVAGKSLGIFLTTMVQFYVYLAFFVLVWGVRPNGSVAGLAVMSAAICACCAALTMLLASLGRSEQGVHSLSMLIILAMSALGGSMFPYELMPEKMKGAATFTINKWAITGLDAVLWRGYGFGAVLVPAAVLVGLAAVFLIAGARLFRFTA